MKRLPVRQLDPAGANDGDVPTYDAAADRVVYAPPAGGGGSLDDLIDVDAASPTVGDVLVYNGTAWVPGVSGGGGGGGGVLLLTPGGTVPAGTAVGTIVFEQLLVQDTQAEIAFDAPVVHLTMDETTGNFLDISGNGNHFAYGGGSRGLPSLIGDTGYSAAASGSAAVGSLASHAGCNNGATVEAVISVPATLNLGAAMLKVGTANNGWTLAFNGTRAMMIVRDGIAYAVSTYTLPAGAGVYRIAATRDGSSNFALYVNGELKATVTGSINTPGAGLFIARDNNDYAIPGVAFDDVCFYNKALTPERVAAHGGTHINSGKSLGWWDGTQLQPLA